MPPKPYLYMRLEQRDQQASRSTKRPPVVTQNEQKSKVPDNKNQQKNPGQAKKDIKQHGNDQKCALSQEQAAMIDLKKQTLKKLKQEKYDQPRLVEDVEKILREYNKQSRNGFQKNIIEFRYEAAKFFNTLADQRKLQAYNLITKILQDPSSLKQHGYSEAHLRVFCLKIKYELAFSRYKTSSDNFFGGEDVKIYDILKSERSGLKLSGICLFLNQLAWHYFSITYSRVNFASKEKKYYEKRVLQQQMQRLGQLYLNNKNNGQLLQDKLSLTASMHVSHDNHDGKPFGVQHSSTTPSQKEGKYKELREFFIKEQIIEGNPRSEFTYHLCSSLDYKVIKRQIKYQNGQIPFLNLHQIYFPLEDSAIWMKIYNKRNYRLIPEKLWNLFQFFTFGISIQNYSSWGLKSSQTSKSRVPREICLDLPTSPTTPQKTIKSDKIEADKQDTERLEFAKQIEKINSSGINNPPMLSSEIKAGSSIFSKTRDILLKQNQRKNQQLEEKNQYNAKRNLSCANNERETTYKKYQNSQQKSVQARGRGISNAGNTCYLNSALQCLHKTEVLNDTIGMTALSSQLAPLAYRSQYLMKQLWKDKPYDPCDARQIRKIVGSYNPIFQGHRQNDSLEFLNTLLSLLGQQLNQAPQERQAIKINHYSKDDGEIYSLTCYRDQQREQSIIDNIFTGRYKTTYECMECRSTFTLFEKFNVHYLPLPPPEQIFSQHNYGRKYYPYESYQPRVENKKHTLTQCLQAFEQEEMLEGASAYPCRDCDRDTPTRKRMEVYQANKVLIIGLKRFHDGRKNDRKISVDELLSPPDFKHRKDLHSSQKYRLYGLILHFGSLHGGHYTAICYNYNSGQWIEYNDSRISIASSYSVREENVYGLFYELVLVEDRKANERKKLLDNK